MLRQALDAAKDKSLFLNTMLQEKSNMPNIDPPSWISLMRFIGVISCISSYTERWIRLMLQLDHTILCVPISILDDVEAFNSTKDKTRITIN
jgi:hypothetical protein